MPIHVRAEPGDYANPIEPSGKGGLKIARGVAALIGATIIFALSATGNEIGNTKRAAAKRYLGGKIGPIIQAISDAL